MEPVPQPSDVDTPIGNHPQLLSGSTTTEPEDDYFSTNPAPQWLAESVKLAKAFIGKNSEAGRRVALVTSGGTTVPLENQTVRFIDNFSAGTRGATSTEYLLEHGYTVIFLHRKFSLLPYSRHYSHSTNCFLDFMAEGQDGRLYVKDEYQRGMNTVLRKYTSAKEQDTLLILSFSSVNEYLWSLREIANALRPLGASALLYLAAAVSDFFIPKNRLSEHKIQSSEAGGLGTKQTGTAATGQGLPQPVGKRMVIDLDPVPKFLKRLVDGWAPHAMIVSFKLETDPSILISKAQSALERYSHHLVIGNFLSTRAWEVVFVTPNAKERWIRIPARNRVKSASALPPFVGKVPSVASTSTTSGTDFEVTNSSPIEIESIIVPEVIKLHNNHIQAAATRLQSKKE